MVGTSPQQAMTTSGSGSGSLEAKAQIPSPRAQWSTASSAVSQSCCGCEAPARLALDVYCLQAAQAVGAASTCLPRLDAVVFTGEIGNDHPQVRSDICGRPRILGIDSALASATGHDTILSQDGARLPVIALTVGEDLQIAEETRSVLEDLP